MLPELLAEMRSIFLLRCSSNSFKKSKTPAEVASFLQSLRDLLPVELFFALKTNGTIWNVDSCDSEKILESLRLVE